MISIFNLYETIEIEPQKPHNDLGLFIRRNQNKRILWSPKIDGARCWVVNEKQTVKTPTGFRKIARVHYYSRSGKQFPNFDIFNPKIIELSHILNREKGIKYPHIFDCEASTTDKSLKGVMTQLHRIYNVEPDKFILNIFDLVLDSKQFEDRHKLVCSTVDQLSYEKIKPLYYYPLQEPLTFENIDKLTKRMIRQGYEGIMLTTSDAKYMRGKRNPNLARNKKRETIDLKIINIELGKPGTKFEGLVASFICSYKGKRLSISGRLSNQDRQYYAEHPPIGMYAEVSYSEITSSGSLRDPIIIRIREDK